MCGEGIYPESTDCTTITIQGDFEFIEAGAFADSAALKYVIFETTKLKTIGDSAFQGCTSLETITIPATVCFLNESAFSSCTSLLSMTFEEGSLLETIGPGCFAGCQNIESFTFPQKLKTMMDYAFNSCQSLSTVIFEEGCLLETIGPSCFGGCKSIEEFTFPPNLKTIMESAFAGTAIYSITIPSKVETIGEYVFRGASLNILNLRQADSLENLGKECFAWMYNTQGELYIPPKIKRIPEYAFAQFKMSSLVFAEESLLEIIDDYAFFYCGLTTSVSLPLSLKVIGERAFYKMQDGSTEKATAWAIDFSNAVNLESIAEWAFAENNMTGDVIIHHNVNFIGNFAFFACNELTSINLTNAENLATIEHSAFLNCKVATGDLVFHSKVETIGYQAFYECNCITSIDFTHATKLSSIGMVAFYRLLVATGSVVIHPSVKRIETTAFYECKCIESIDLSRSYGLQEIQSFAFKTCEKATDNIMFHSELADEVGSGLFYGCSSITSVDLSNLTHGLTIGSSCFYGCESLATVKCDSVVLHYDSSAFGNCPNLVYFECHFDSTFDCSDPENGDFGEAAMSNIKTVRFYGQYNPANNATSVSIFVDSVGFPGMETFIVPCDTPDFKDIDLGNIIVAPRNEKGKSCFPTGHFSALHRFDLSDIIELAFTFVTM